MNIRIALDQSAIDLIEAAHELRYMAGEFPALAGRLQQLAQQILTANDRFDDVHRACLMVPF
jgi:hypothetical protein